MNAEGSKGGGTATHQDVPGHGSTDKGMPGRKSTAGTRDSKGSPPGSRKRKTDQGESSSPSKRERRLARDLGVFVKAWSASSANLKRDSRCTDSSLTRAFQAVGKRSSKKEACPYT